MYNPEEPLDFVDIKGNLYRKTEFKKGFDFVNQNVEQLGMAGLENRRKRRIKSRLI